MVSVCEHPRNQSCCPQCCRKCFLDSQEIDKRETCKSRDVDHRTDIPVVPFKTGDLVRRAADMPGFENTVYTVAGVRPGTRGWVKLQEYANEIGYEGLRRVTDTPSPSHSFPAPLLDPGLKAKKQILVEHSLSDGGFVSHFDYGDGRLFCPICGSSSEFQPELL
jgi:hypothetical protein